MLITLFPYITGGGGWVWSYRFDGRVDEGRDRAVREKCSRKINEGRPEPYVHGG